MTFTIGVYRAGNVPADGWVWVVRGDGDQVVAEGREPTWPDALTEVHNVMWQALYDSSTAMVYRPLEA